MFRVFALKIECMSFVFKRKIIAGTINTTSFLKEVNGSNFKKSPKQPQSVTFILFSSNAPQPPKLKKFTPALLKMLVIFRKSDVANLGPLGSPYHPWTFMDHFQS